MELRTRNRIIAAGLLLGMTAGAVESVAGELLDSSEHYEEAAAHAEAPAVGDETRPADSEDEDQHIKGYDHCTHVHGLFAGPAALPVTRTFLMAGSTCMCFPALPPDAPRSPPYHPPKH